MMKEGLKFIEGGAPLTNRVWFEADESLDKNKVIEIMGGHISSIPQSLALEVHFFVSHPTEKTNNNLIEILQSIYQFKVGYEKSFPIVSIYYPYNELNLEVLERINACDQYRPGIRIYLLVRDKDLPCENSLSSMRGAANKLVDKLQASQALGLDTTIYFFMEEDPCKLEQMLELRRLAYTWDTSINMKKPMLQVSPHIPFDKDMIKKLEKYIQKENESIDTMNTICGLTSLLIRYRENRAVPACYVPLGGCGAGISERKYCGNESSTLCFFSAKSSMKEDAFKVCKNCKHVLNCTGCLLMCTDFDECKLKAVFDTYAENV